MKHLDKRELIAGLMLTGVGLFVALYAAEHYQIGQPARMGPGFFPVALGSVLAFLGVVVALLAFRPTVHVLVPPPFAARPLIAVLISIAVFTLMINRLGLIPATLALVMIAACAERPYKLRRTVLLAIALAVIAWLTFTVGLQMTLPAFAFEI